MKAALSVCACPVCEPDEFDGGLEVVPAAVPCLAHVNHPVMRFFPYPYEIPSAKSSVSMARLAKAALSSPGKPAFD